MTAKLYINTDIDITLTIGSGLVIGDIQSLTLTLTHATTGSVTTFSGGNVVIGTNTVIVKIPDTGGITVPGIYLVKVLFTDQPGNLRGLTPLPDFLRFYS